MSKKKEKVFLPLGISAVAFTIQFGGGFASGNQIMQYFVDYGVWSIILPVISSRTTFNFLLLWLKICFY